MNDEMEMEMQKAELRYENEERKGIIMWSDSIKKDLNNISILSKIEKVEKENEKLKEEINKLRDKFNTFLDYYFNKSGRL